MAVFLIDYKISARMKLYRIWTMYLRQMFLLRRSPLRLVAMFYWSVIDLFVWGFLTLYLNRIGAARFDFLTLLLGSVMLLSFFTRVLHGISISFMEDMWTRNLLNLFGSPLSIHEYAIALILVSITESFISLGFVAMLAWFLFAYTFAQFGIFLIPFFGILLIFGLAVGIFTTAVVLRYGPSAEIFAWSIPVLLTPLSAVYYPISALPNWLQVFARLLPTAYVFEGMRAVVLINQLDTHPLLMGFGLAMFYFIGAYLFLYRSYKSVLRRGTLTRFVTE